VRQFRRADLEEKRGVIGQLKREGISNLKIERRQRKSIDCRPGCQMLQIEAKKYKWAGHERKKGGNSEGSKQTRILLQDQDSASGD